MEKKRNEGGVSVYILGVYALVLLLVIFLCDMQKENMSNLQKEFDTGILLSLLGSANINVEEYGRTGNRVLHETYTGEGEIWGAVQNAVYTDSYLDAALFQFQNLLKNNLGLNSEGRCNKNMVLSPISLEEFKVFNVYENPDTGEKQIYEFIWSDSAWSSIVHGVNERVYVQGAGNRGLAAIEITDTTLYAHIAFDITVLPYLSTNGGTDSDRVVRVHMARCISVPENEIF